MLARATLFCDGVAVAPVELADTKIQKTMGLLGRSHINGAMVFRNVARVHTFFMRFPIDVAYCDDDGIVIATETLLPNRLGTHHAGCALLIECQAQSLAKWRIKKGVHIDVRANR